MHAKACDCGPTLAELLVDRSPEKLTLQLSEVNSAITRLSERSRELREQINATTRFLSLPAEIISEISAMACQPVYNANDPDNFATSTQLTTPLMLGKICRTWRHIAWASPWLWNVIFLGLRREAEVYKAQVEVLEAWLLRSGDLLLSIHLSELDDVPGGWIESPPTELFNLLARYSHRWLHLRTFLIGPCWGYLEELAVPFLTSLAFGPPGSRDVEYRGTWRNSNAPCLRNVYIAAFTRDKVKLPMYQLTRVTWGSLDWQSCLLLLADTPNVVHCTLLDVGAFGDTSYQPVILLPHMSSFTIDTSSSYGCPLGRILDCITAPSLYRMQLASSELSGSELWATIWAFLSQSSCALRELSLKAKHCKLNEMMLIALLAVMDSLEKLELICSEEGILDPILNHLNPARPGGIPQFLPAGQILLPSLRRFRYKGPMRFQIKTLVEMIDVRYRMANDMEENSEPGREEHRNRVATPEAFNIDILGVDRVQHTSLSVSARTLQRLVKEHRGITFSFLDNVGNNIPLMS